MGTAGDLGREFMNEFQRRNNSRLEEEFSAGFNEAANLCIDILNQKMEDLSDKISAGTFLSEPEQLLWAKLNELKSETEQSLYAYPGDSISDT